MIKNKSVLVTGITGFVGSHIAIQLLNKGYHVRGSLRDLNRTDSIKSVIAENCKTIENLNFTKGDLTNPHHWNTAMEEIDYVIHVASPLPFDLKTGEDDLIVPAREGTINVLYAAEKHKVKKVVLTSSVAAVAYGPPKQSPLNENDWTIIRDQSSLPPYIKSKTLAEKAAWEFVNQPDVNLELSVINPGFIFGPLLERDYPDSARVLISLMKGKYPGMPRIGLPIVDVRDVATMHINALEQADTSNKRFIAVNDSLWLCEMAKIIKSNFPSYSKKIKSREIPDIVIRLLSYVKSDLRKITPDLGKKNEYDNANSMKILDTGYRSNDEIICSMAETLIKFKHV